MKINDSIGTLAAQLGARHPVGGPKRAEIGQNWVPGTQIRVPVTIFGTEIC